MGYLRGVNDLQIIEIIINSKIEKAYIESCMNVLNDLHVGYK